MPFQPYLHDLTVIVAAPGVALSPPDGQLRSGADGIYFADRRILSRLVLRADSGEPDALGVIPLSAGQCRFVGVLRELGDNGADPTVTVDRLRTIATDGCMEQIRVTSAARDPVRALLTLDIACDGADIAAVKSGRAGPEVVARPIEGGFEWTIDDGRVRASCDPAPDTAADGTLGWHLDLSEGGSFEITLTASALSVREPVVLPSQASVRRSGFSVTSGDSGLNSLVEQSLADLDGLLLADPLEPSDSFPAAGAPWFLTLFGRDAIWAARMLLPLGTELAAGTLRTLARRQGNRVDAESAQQPGKILHEIRPGATTHTNGHTSGGLHLPPLYYGTVDATPLWISLLHDAWRSGLSDNEIEPLLPHLERAMGWLLDYALGDDAFVSYRDATGHGLANQGWKDSGDAVQFSDGSLATAPIALCEAQGYAFAAAYQAAALADAFGRSGGAAWRSWADELAERFRAAFWLTDDAGRYPAIAVDGRSRAVDTVTSNIGHLLGTGLLDDGEERIVVNRLGRADLDSGFGLRTLSTTARGFNPFAYHAGSVWTHDTAIAISGLAAAGTGEARRVAASLAAGLLHAAPAFDFRMPELFAGVARADTPIAIPYPAACRPQAWAATASIAMVAALLGLRIDVPGSTVRLRPIRPCPVGALEVRGLRYGAVEFAVRLDEHGDPVVDGLPRDVRVLIE